MIWVPLIEIFRGGMGGYHVVLFDIKWSNPQIYNMDLYFWLLCILQWDSFMQYQLVVPFPNGDKAESSIIVCFNESEFRELGVSHMFNDKIKIAHLMKIDFVCFRLA